MIKNEEIKEKLKDIEIRISYLTGINESAVIAASIYYDIHELINML